MKTSTTAYLCDLTLVQDVHCPTTELARILRLYPKDQPIIEAIAQNPNTPMALLCSLGEDAVAAVVKNPALEMYFLEDSEVFLRCPVRMAIKIARYRETPSWILQALASPKQPALVREAVAQNPHTPAHTLQRLARDEDRSVVARAVANRSVPVDVFEKALRKGPDVRAGVAANVAAPADILTKLAHDEHVWVRSVVASNPALPSEALERLLTDAHEHDEVKASARCNPRLWREKRHEEK